jgi:hypothetical protein
VTGFIEHHLPPKRARVSIGKSQWLQIAGIQGIDEKEALAMYAEAEARESRIIGAFTSRITGREMTYIAYRNR